MQLLCGIALFPKCFKCALFKTLIISETEYSSAALGAFIHVGMVPGPPALG